MKWLDVDDGLLNRPTDVRNMWHSVNLIQAIDIEDAVYIIMIGMDKLNLTDTHSHFEGALVNNDIVWQMY